MEEGEGMVRNRHVLSKPRGKVIHTCVTAAYQHGLQTSMTEMAETQQETVHIVKTAGLGELLE